MFRVFFLFSARGSGKGSLRRWEGGGGTIFYWKCQEAGSPGQVGAGGGGQGAGRVSAGNLGGGGSLNFFFRGRNSHQVMVVSGSSSVGERNSSIESPFYLN